MKRMLCAALALLIACLAPGMAETDAVDALLAQLSAFMDAREAICARRSAALQAVREFCVQDDYPTLLAARIASSDAAAELRGTALPTMDLSDDELTELMAMGVGADALEVELQGMEATLAGAIDGMIMFQSMLYSTAYQNSQMDTLRDWVSISERRLELDMAYDCNLINDLLLPISDIPAAMAFWNELERRWPTVGGAKGDWKQDPRAVLETADAIMDGYAALVDESSEVLGRDAYDYERFSDNLLSEDWDALKGDAHIIPDMPLMVPMPQDWLTPATMSLSLVRGEDGVDTLVMMDEGVSLKSFFDYVDMLDSLNIAEIQRGGSDEEGWTSFVLAGASPLVLRWMPGDIAAAAYDPGQITLESYFYILCAGISGEEAGG